MTVGDICEESCGGCGGSTGGGACTDDEGGALEGAVGMDCAGAMAAIPTTPSFTGEVCDFSLQAWLSEDVTVRDVCGCSCGGGSAPPPPAPYVEDPCATHAHCLNGGQCREYETSIFGAVTVSMMCNCASGFAGDNCECAESALGTVRSRPIPPPGPVPACSNRACSSLTMPSPGDALLGMD